ncbi:hypothetical protein BCR42DRAFT_96481 [Absidia repens]|uniref:VPS9 domain-containing protein n=1 Tax=Absidia repens TaxID=90262 RepID=A0A1X2I8W2_9FUNG|nr:hypothetical protein BCR42DRAFT_96481 [Absidia repens]
MIPLLAYVIVHSRISRMASLVFYVEHFRLSQMERPEHGFALATLKTAVSFLKTDRSLLKITSTDYTSPTSTVSSASLSLQSQNLRSKSTSPVSPLASPTLSISQHSPVYNHYSTTEAFQVSSYKPAQASKPPSALPSSSSLSSLNIRHGNLQRPTAGLLHRKSQSVGPPCISNDQTHQQQRQQKQQQRQSSPSSSSSSSSSSDSCKEDDYMGMISTPNYHRHSYTPKNCSEIYVQGVDEVQPTTDHSYDWILYDNDISKLSSDLIATIDTSQHDQPQRQHQQQRPSYCHNVEVIHNSQQQQFTQPSCYRAHNMKPITPPKFALGGTRPIFSATTPIISNSNSMTLQVDDIPPAPLVANTIKQQQHQRHNYHHQHYQCSTTSPKHQDTTAAQLEPTSNCAMAAYDSLPKSESSRPTTILSSNTLCHFTIPDLPNLLYREPSLNALNNASQPHSRLTMGKRSMIQHLHSPAKSTAPQLQPLINNLPQQPPQIIHVTDRLLSFDNGGLGRRSSSFCLDTRSSSSSSSSFMYGRPKDLNHSQEGLGEFLLGLQKLDGDVVGEGDGHVSR